MLAAFGGIAPVALGHGAGGSAETSVAGPTWMLLSTIAIAFYYVWSVELTEEYGTASVAAWSTLFGFLALLPWAGREAWLTQMDVALPALGAALYLGAVVSVAGLLLWLRILRDVPAPIASSVQYLQPVFGIAASAVIFGDRFGTMFVFGVVLILAGLVLPWLPFRWPAARG